MRVSDLIDYLSDLNPDAEVRLAYQPTYPLWCGTGGVAAGTENGHALASDECEECGGTDGDHYDGCPQRDNVTDVHAVDLRDAEYVYITAGSDGGGYASSSLWSAAEEARW